METKTYRKITTGYVNYNEKFGYISIKGIVEFSVAQARQLHAELGEVLKAIEEK